MIVKTKRPFITNFWISGFPIWVSLLGIIFFEVIDRDEDGILEFDEIKNYYKGLVGVKEEDLYVVSKEGYRALTAVRKCFFVYKFVFCSQNCSCDQEKVLKFEAEGRKFAKILRSLAQFIQSVQFLEQNYFLTYSWNKCSA